MNVTIADLSPQQLRRAADVAEQIESLKNQLAEILGDLRGQYMDGGGRKRKISAAGLARIRAAQKARWAKIKGAGDRAVEIPKRKRRMSAAAKARLSAVAKARWKKAKAAGKTALSSL
jgi:hypothetical protein